MPVQKAEKSIWLECKQRASANKPRLHELICAEDMQCDFDVAYVNSAFLLAVQKPTEKNTLEGV